MRNKVKAVLLDLDGTIYVDDDVIPGAPEAIRRLREAGIPYRFATNTTRRSRRATVENLGRLGIGAEEREVFSAPVAAAAWLDRQGAQSIRLLVDPSTREDFAAFAIDQPVPQYVVVGDLGRAWSYDILNVAFRDLLGGAELVAIQKNRYWKTSDGLSLDAGAFVTALEYASSKTATLVGKPSRAFFDSAAADLGVMPQEIVMVGDDLEADVEGATAAGLQAVAVRTGKLGPEEEHRAASIAAVIDSIANLPAWLGI